METISRAYFQGGDNSSIQIGKYLRLFMFYVVETPLGGCSAREKTYATGHWIGKATDANKNRKFNEFLSGYVQEKDALIWCEASDFEKKLQENDLNECFPPQKFEEKVVYKNTEDNYMKSLFRHIRNAFAHGSYCIQTSRKVHWFVFEDQDKHKNLSARGMLKVETLFNWMTIIQTGPQP